MKHANASISSLLVSCIVDGFEITFSISWAALGSCAVRTRRNEQMRHAELAACSVALRHRVIIGTYTYSYLFQVQLYLHRDHTLCCRRTYEPTFTRNDERAPCRFPQRGSEGRGFGALTLQVLPTTTTHHPQQSTVCYRTPSDTLPSKQTRTAG